MRGNVIIVEMITKPLLFTEHLQIVEKSGGAKVFLKSLWHWHVFAMGIERLGLPKTVTDQCKMY